MIEINRPQQRQRLRRIALSAQGLLQAQPFGSGLAGARKAIRHIGYVQIDSISVVERAHHHVLYCRVPKFKPAIIDRLLQDRDIFEYWSHAAAFLPISDFRFSLPYKHAVKSGQTHWYKNPDKKLMAQILAQIRSDGPLRSRDIKNRANKRSGWWDWKPAKKALEQLYMQGDLMVRDREGFQKTYDLTERVLPPNTNIRMPSTDAFAQHILEQQLRCHGLVSFKGLTYLRRNAALRNAVKTQVSERLSQGQLEQVRMPDGEHYFIRTGAFEHPSPRANRRISILSPFDNAAIQRDRLKSIFEFDYQIECYLPEAKRQYGYFCLLLLYGDTLVGRMDCKAHRKAGNFEIKSLHMEAHDFDEEAVIHALTIAIAQFCTFQRCESVTLRQAYPRRLTKVVRIALQHIE